jgi:hypothetical protein
MNKPKNIYFSDYPNFRPNLTPTQIFQFGSFGGTYWRPIYSKVACKYLHNIHKKNNLKKLFEGIDENKLSSSKCNININKYNVKSGTSLEFWESKKWIKSPDYYGWVHWYCLFYLGRRTKDDSRQIKRWENFAGKNGRFRKRLINLIKKKNTVYDDYSISPVIRQGLLHWGYELTEKDFKDS